MFEQRQERRQWDRHRLEQFQLLQLNQLLGAILPHNTFYRNKFGDSLQLDSLADLAKLPFTTKEELLNPGDTMGMGRHHTWARERYQRFHRTSGTTGRPLVVLDTAEDWQAWIQVWQYVLDVAKISAADTVFMAFSFGPFVGFWSAHDALLARQAMVITGGGMSTIARLELIQSSEATIVCCTPSYALHMAEVAAQHGLNLAGTTVRSIIVAGEPGGSIPTIRQRLQDAWGAEVIDHAGATEIGPWGVGTTDGTSLQVIEPYFIAEYLPLEIGADDDDTGLRELVITNLFRRGAPLLRYRTGDLVQPRFDHPDDDCRFVRLDGGIRGRVDDMLIVRGVNIFPSSVESILRSFPEVIEYRVIVCRNGQLDQLHIEVEDHLHQPARIADRCQAQLGLRVSVEEVPVNSLPRFEGKGRRWIDRRHDK